MTPLKIFSDSPFDKATLHELREKAAPHEILLPKQAATSVLGKTEADPSFPLADVAFGQPGVESVCSSTALKWLHVSTAGFTRYDTAEFRAFANRRGLIVTNSSSVYAAACAEHVLAFMLAQSRLLPTALASQAANGSEEWFQLRENSVTLRGQSVVILGYGGIATELVKLLAPFEMKITAMRRTPRGDEGVPVVSPQDLAVPLALADHVINILPDNADSENFVDAACFASMKPGVIFHNIGRGTTVDQDALVSALRSGQVAAAWLDVTDPEPLPIDHPLRAQPNCHITPHLAGGHASESSTLVRHFLANLRRYEAGEPLCDRIM